MGMMSPEVREGRLLFYFGSRDILEAAADPLAALRTYLEQEERREDEEA